jgi:hypothetical protein
MQVSIQEFRWGGRIVAELEYFKILIIGILVALGIY